jgi:protocatechuate 3,4-dioxygenase beta subunit
MTYLVEPFFEDEELPPLALPQDEGLAVRVVDDAGQPLAGARLAVESAGGPRRSWRPGLSGRPATRSAVSDDDGRAELPRRSGETLRVTAAAPGHAPATATSDGAALTLTLAPGRLVTVVVRDGDGHLVPGAVVSVLPGGVEPSPDGAVPLGRSDDEGRRPAWQALDAGLRLVAHDEAGRYGLDHYPALSEMLAGSEREGGEHDAAVAEAAEPDAAPSAGLLRVFLAPRTTLSGRTLTAADRAPIAGAVVWPAGHPEAAVLSGSDGGFSLSLPEPVASRGWLRLHAAAAGFQPAAESPPGDGASTTLLLRPTSGLVGRVVNADGEPVDGARVLAQRLASEGWRSTRRPDVGRATTGGDGRFRLSGLEPGEGYELRARAEGYAEASREVAVADLGEAPTEPVEIVLAAGIRAFGHVMDEDDRPVAGAEVVLVPEVSATTLRTMMRNLSGGEADPGSSATTDADGRFEIGDRSAGRFLLQVAAVGFAPQRVPGVELPAGSPEVDLGTVILAPGVELVGRVTDPDDHPLEGAEVTLTSGGFGIFMGRRGHDVRDPLRTDADGLFRISDLTPEETLNLLVKHEGFTQRHVRGVRAPSEEPLEIVLEPAGRISGRVLDEAGSPVEHAYVFAQREEVTARFDGAPSYSSSDENGNFTLDDVAPGDVSVQVRAEGFQSLTRRGLRITAGEELRDLTLRLSRGATVEGRVFGADGEPLAGATVRALSSSQNAPGFDSRSANTDTEGRYRLGGLPFTHLTFAAEDENHVRAVRDLDLAPGDNRLDFRLEAGLSVSGRVVNAGGEPVLAAQVHLSTTGVHWSPEGTDTDADGAFTLRGVQPGTYRLTATKDGYAAAVREGLAVTAPVQGIELVLERGAAIVGHVLGADLDELSKLRLMAVSASAAGMPLFGNVDYEGNYRIEGVAPGNWRVMVMLDQGGPRAMELVSVEPGAREVPLDLDLGGGGLTLTGRVLLAGQPLSGATVMVSGGGSGLGFATTDQRGSFRIESLEAGTYDLMVRSANNLSPLLRDEIELDGDRDLTLSLRSTEIRGRVLDAATGAPVADAAVHLDTLQDDGTLRDLWPATHSDDAGLFTLSGVPDGTYRLRAEQSGYSPAEVELQVADGLAVDGLELALQPTGGLLLDVRSAFGSVPSRIQVAALDPATLPAAGAAEPAEPRVVFAGSAMPGEGGRVTLDRLPPGTWKLLVGSDASGVAELQVTVPGPPQSAVLPPACELVVTVPALAETRRGAKARLLRADGSPFVGLNWGGRAQTSWELFLGAVRIFSLPPGDWRLEVTSTSGDTWTGGVTTIPGVTEVELP